jgi:hypothetical protein
MFTHSRLSGLILCGGMGTRRNSFLSTVDCAAVLSGAKPEDDAAVSGPASAEPMFAERDDGPAEADAAAPGVEVMSSSSAMAMDLDSDEDEEALGWEVTREIAGAGSSCDCSAFWRCDLWAMMRW